MRRAISPIPIWHDLGYTFSVVEKVVIPLLDDIGLEGLGSNHTMQLLREIIQ